MSTLSLNFDFQASKTSTSLVAYPPTYLPFQSICSSAFCLKYSRLPSSTTIPLHTLQKNNNNLHYFLQLAIRFVLPIRERFLSFQVVMAILALPKLKFLAFTLIFMARLCCYTGYTNHNHLNIHFFSLPILMWSSS